MLDEVHKCQMNRWSREWNQQGDKAEIAPSRGGKQETPVGGLQGEGEGAGPAKIRAETKADMDGPQAAMKSRGQCLQ